jgi:membrane dipeptidase
MFRTVSLFLLTVIPAMLPAQAEDAALVRARQFLSTRPIIDGHNDLPWEIRVNEISKMDVTKYPLRTQAPGQTDLPRLKRGGVGGQFWSVYLPFEMADSGYAKVQLEQIDIAKQIIAMYPDELELARSSADIVRIMKAGKIASLLGMEGGHAIENSLALLRQYYELGARYMTLTHNGTLDWADAATGLPEHGGLTEFGREVVREMNRIGMIVDLSHVAPSTMSDVLDVATAPIIYSHSSARAILDHPRNVPDSILRRLPANGGVVMVTFVGSFISPSMAHWSQMMRDSLPATGDREARRAAQSAFIARHPRPQATVAELADHVDHIKRVAGVDHVGLGGDYDGTSELPAGMEDVSGYPLLFAELIRRGWNEADLTKLAGGNILRVLQQVELVRDRAAARR